MYVLRKIYSKNFGKKGLHFFFFNREKKWDGLVRDNVTIWKPENLAISTTPYGHAFSNIFNEIAFIYGKPCQSSNTTISDDLVEMECEEFDPKNISHVKSVFRLHFLNKENKQDKYACRELLWYLNNYYIDFDLLLRVFNGFEASLVRPFFLNELKKYSYCLSIPKQDLIQRLISHFNGTYNIYVPSELLNALRVIDSNYNPYTDWKSNIFDLVDKATFELKNRDSDKKYNVLEDNSISNIFLKIRRWLLDESYTFTEFNKLQKLIRLFAPKQQLRLLNRYFLAVKKQQTSFDIELIKQFKDNKFDNWGIYYHCACTASKPVPIGLQILCDCLLTFLSTNGTAFQTINGILDLAFSKCNVNSPAIDFQLKNIVPICNGGAIPNKNNFKGFICYEIIQIINEDYFDKYDCIYELAQNIISTFSNNQDYKEKCVIHNDSSICQKKQTNHSLAPCQIVSIIVGNIQSNGLLLNLRQKNVKL